MSSVNLENLVKELSKLTVMEAANLSKMLEETWGVSAAAPVAAAAAVAEEAVEEKTEFDVMLVSVEGSSKINVIKAVRDITKLGLGESKALVEAAPGLVKAGVPKADAEKFKKDLEAAGAKVELK